MRRLVLLVLFATSVLAQDAPDFTPPASAQQLGNGLAYVQLAPGTGTVKPAGDDLVKVRHAIWREDGKLLEKMPADRAAVMSLARMMPGWRTIIENMAVGERGRAWIPSDLTGGKSAQDLVIDTELVGIVKGPATPADLTAPPADAEKTKSGLTYKVITPGSGIRKPRRTSTVRVNYSGWTTDGRLFDSTALRDAPAEFRLDQVIAGWTEGLQMMVEGETRRFWIPAKLAYATDPSKPQGMLVFDIELLQIK